MSGRVLSEKKANSFGIARLILLLLVFLVFFALPFFPALFSDSRFYGVKADSKAPDFVLTNLSGQQVSLSDFRGKPVFLMFGYLNCDSLCHNQVMLFQEINALNLTAPEPSPVFLYIAMDPERDKAEKIAQYFDAHADNFISLNATDYKLAQAIAMKYGAYFSRSGKMSSGDYEIDHPGHIFLIDQAGNKRFTYSASHKQADRIFSDLHFIRTEEQKTITLPGV